MSNNTCYPSFSFLPLQWNHHPRRNFFLDCGTLGSVYVCEDGETLVQKTHNDQKCHLCAQFPSLPLFKKPKYGISGIDPVDQQNLKKRNQKFLYLGKRMKELKTLLKRKKYKPDAILNLLKSVYDYENGDCSMESVLDNFNQITELRKVYERYSDLFNVDVQKTNTSFTGGCLHIVNIPGEPSRAENDSVHMAAVLGPKLNKIKIFRADLEKSGLISVDESEMIEIESSQPLFELSNQCLYDQSLLAGRSKDSCFLYNISTENSIKCLDKISLKNEDLTSVFMSPYIPAECLIATDSGSVYLWNADKGYDLVYGLPKGVKCLSRWRDVHYGSHPRSFVLTDHSSMDLFDLRTGKKATNLFSLPCRHLKNRERLQVSKFSTRNSFQHFLATDYALFLLDERYPRYPVLQWQHMLEGLPQYMCLVTEVVQSLQEDVLMVGSQYPAEVINIQYRTFETNPPIAVTSPWRISKPLDLFYINNMHHKVEDFFVKKRLTASCIGIVGQPLNPEGMLAFQVCSDFATIFLDIPQLPTCFYVVSLFLFYEIFHHIYSSLSFSLFFFPGLFNVASFNCLFSLSQFVHLFLSLSLNLLYLPLSLSQFFHLFLSFFISFSLSQFVHLSFSICSSLSLFLHLFLSFSICSYLSQRER
ncbi:TAF1C [Acanthosepion pharaonis]|uniref:TAF1C n=1 Tax=Acanthosepion pharaonis TaxID=158019 RepID=A0A812EVL6_ACAPH|nr:TAF1C [Sepia pharaonis]